MTTLTVSQWLLLILAERVLRIHEKYKHIVAVAAHEVTLVPAARAYIAAYQTLQTHGATKTLALAEGRARVQTLYTGILHWLGIVARDIPGFSIDPALRVAAPDRVIVFAENLVAMTQQHADRLSFSASLIENVGALLEAARTAWEHAQEALGQHQALQAAVREQGAVFYRELATFRRTLRNAVGSTNRDYRLLRNARDEAPETDPEQPAAPGAEPTAPSTQPGPMPAPGNGISPGVSAQ